MNRRSPFVVLAAGTWLALCFATGCNAVLGIEEASPRENDSASPASTGPSGPTSGAYTSGLSCENPNKNCSDCIDASCSTQSTEVSTCLRDPDCRNTLDDYAACLGRTCAPNEAECFEPLIATNVPRCVLMCKDKCEQTPLYSACQLYCACMGANCNDKLGSGSDAAFSSMTNCVAQCEVLNQKSPELVACRRTHCEMAGLFPDELHCDHATGVTFCAGSVKPPVREAGCKKSLNSFACLADGDCCSGKCGVQKACEAK